MLCICRYAGMENNVSAYILDLWYNLSRKQPHRRKERSDYLRIKAMPRDVIL